jgi:transcriptional regulator with XRE-family HTH domain
VVRYLEYEKALGERLKTLREDRNLSQRDLAFLAGVEQNQISRLENAKHGVTISTLIAISVALGYRLEQLFKFGFEIELNQNFDVSNRKGLPVTESINKAIIFGFFDTPREVKEVVQFCNSLDSVKYQSSSISNALKKLVKRGVIQRIPSAKQGNFLYKKMPKN